MLCIDIGKNVCSLVGLDAAGAVVLRRRAKRETLIDLASKLPQYIVVSFMRWLLHFYSLGNFLRTLAVPEPIKDWSMTTLKDKLIKIGAKVVSHGRYVAFQMADVAIPRDMFADILRMIAELRPPPAASRA
jgi:hypothetical protein